MEVPVPAQIAAPPARRYPFWATLGTALLVLVTGFVAAILIAIPTVLILGPARNPGDPGTNVIEAGFYLGGTAVLIPLLQRLSGRSLAELGIRPLTRRDWAYVAGGTGAVFAIQFVYQVILTAFHQQNHTQAGFEHFAAASPAAAIFVLVTGAIVAPICEELFFRGLVFNALAVRTPMLVAAVLSSLLFGAAHGDWILFPVLACFGLIQALIYQKSGSLVVPMIVHSLNNGIFLALMILIPGFH